MSKLKCKHCQSTELVSVDNEPLSHNGNWLQENKMQFDNEIYIKFHCRDCGKNSVHVLEVKLRQ